MIPEVASFGGAWLAVGQGGLAPQDSGGGVFVFENGQWQLVATSAFVFPSPGGTTTQWGAGGGGVYLTSLRGVDHGDGA